MGAVEFFADRAQLTLLELTDGESAPPVGGADDGGERGRGRLIAAARPQRDLRPLTLRRFAAEVAHPMDKAPLAQGPRETCLDGADEARCPVGHGEQRVAQAATFQILEERGAACR